MAIPVHMIESFNRECTPLRIKDRYDCIRCGSCCKGDGKFLELGGAEFVEGLNRYFPPIFVEILGTYHIIGSFVIPPGGTQVCPYLNDDSSCDIYEQRPHTCRAFPFTVILTKTQSEKVTGFPYINKTCQGYGKGRSVTNEKQVRQDIYQSSQIFVNSLKDMTLSMEIGNMLMEKGWLTEFHGKGQLKNYIAKSRVDIPTDDGTYPLIPDKVVWRHSEFLAEMYGIEVEALDVT